MYQRDRLFMRKKNTKRALPQEIVFVQHYHRKRIETVGSLIEQRLPKSIHAVTSEGFELKVGPRSWHRPLYALQGCTWRQLKRRLILQGRQLALPALERVRAAA